MEQEEAIARLLDAALQRRRFVLIYEGEGEGEGRDRIVCNLPLDEAVQAMTSFLEQLQAGAVTYANPPKDQSAAH